MRREKRRSIRYLLLFAMHEQDGSGRDRFLVTSPQRKQGQRVKGSINAAKLLRACGGCLGARRR
jgi:hypothetical protein